MPKPRTARPEGAEAALALTESYVLNIEHAGSTPNMPKTDPSFPFLYAYDRKRWHVYPTPDQVAKGRLKVKPRVLPFLIPLKLVKGLQNVSVRKDRSGNEIGLDVSALMLDQQRRGRTVLPQRLGPEQPDGKRTYCIKVKGRPSFLDAWTRPIPGSKLTRTDHEAKARWLASLIDDGHVPECPLWVLELLDTKLQRSVDRMLDRYAKLPSAGGAVRRWKSIAEVVRTEVERRIDGTPDAEVESGDTKIFFDEEDVLVTED